MKKNLKLKINSQTVNEQKKKIAEAVMSKIKRKGTPEVFLYVGLNGHLYDAQNQEYDISGIASIKCELAKVMDFGWLMELPLLDYEYYRNLARKLQKILTSKTDQRKANRSTFVLSEGQKGQEVILVKIILKDTFQKNFLVLSKTGEIIPSKFGEMFSPNWDGDSEEAMQIWLQENERRQQIEKSLFGDLL